MENKEQSPSNTTVKKSNRLPIIITALITGLIMFIAGFFTFYLVVGKNARTVGWIINSIDSHGYFFDEETGEVKKFTADDYADAIISGLLDRYSDYYNREEYSEVISTSKGNSFGIGVTISNSGGKNVIYSVIGNSPAEKAGIKRGDIITAGEYGGKRSEFSALGDFTNFIDSIEENEEFALFGERGGEQLTFTVAKKVFRTSYVKYYDSEKALSFVSEGSDPLEAQEQDGGMNELAADTAYISLASFNGSAADQIGEALSFMKERGRTKLIFDLRYNGGGYMNVLSDIAAYLVYDQTDKTPVIAYAGYKDGKSDVFRASGDKFNREITDIVVLANDGTASASECLIGAMKYYGRGFDESKLVITKNAEGIARTYGKGIMQTTYYNFLTGEGVKLTTAYVYQPDNKTCIHGKGFVVEGDNAVDGDEQALSRAVQILAE